MTDLTSFDPTLFGIWPPVGDHQPESGAEAWDAERVRRQATRAVIETKSAEQPREDLRLLLNDMTREMRDQFDYFRKLRGAAEALGAIDGDEAAAKLARADVKAATDAMSLIVRTLEKVDSLQRQLTRDRELEAERHAQTPAYEKAKEHFMRQIEARAEEIGRALHEEWKRNGDPPADTGRAASQSAGPDGAPDREEGAPATPGRAQPACGPPPDGAAGDRPGP
ncbi:hypothetical protein [Rhizobium sp. RAF56]|jgi:hypothetical protein|uniref:hypothetical protein n=1 Tax=Rhizobium sp. RAF56 TaxID=3233062 RepID=UPI003F9CEABA